MDDIDLDQRFFTVEALARILREYTWPAPYELEDELPDGVIMRFPACAVMFVEGPQAEMEACFLPEDTGYSRDLTLGHALWVLVPESERGAGPLTPGLIDDLSIYGSLSKVENGIRDLCTILLYHLQPCLLGDFRWVPKFKAMMDALANE